MVNRALGMRASTTIGDDVDGATRRSAPALDSDLRRGRPRRSAARARTSAQRICRARSNARGTLPRARRRTTKPRPERRRPAAAGRAADARAPLPPVVVLPPAVRRYRIRRRRDGQRCAREIARAKDSSRAGARDCALAVARRRASGRWSPSRRSSVLPSRAVHAVTVVLRGNNNAPCHAASSSLTGRGREFQVALPQRRRVGVLRRVLARCSTRRCPRTRRQPALVPRCQRRTRAAGRQVDRNDGASRARRRIARVVGASHQRSPSSPRPSARATFATSLGVLGRHRRRPPSWRRRRAGAMTPDRARHQRVATNLGTLRGREGERGASTPAPCAHFDRRRRRAGGCVARAAKARLPRHAPRMSSATSWRGSREDAFGVDTRSKRDCGALRCPRAVARVVVGAAETGPAAIGAEKKPAPRQGPRRHAPNLADLWGDMKNKN